jgi:hypothetical protein
VSYRALIIGALAMSVTGCATVTRDTTELLVVDSTPAGAEVRLSNGMSGRTPASFRLPRKDAVVVSVEREGFEPVTVDVRPRVADAGAAGLAGNILAGGLIGAAIDAGSGAMMDLTPNPVYVALAPLSGDR